MGNPYLNLLEDYYAAGTNYILKKNKFDQIFNELANDYQKATLVTLGAPGCDSFVFSGIIDVLPGGRKSLNSSEDELIQNLIIELRLPYPDKHLFSHKETIWRFVSATIKNASKKIEASKEA